MVPTGPDPKNRLRGFSVDKDGNQQMVGPPSATQVSGGDLVYEPRNLYQARLFEHQGFRPQDWVLSSDGLLEVFDEDPETAATNTTDAATWLKNVGVTLQCGVNPGDITTFRTKLPVPNSVAAVAGPWFVPQLREGLATGYRVLFGVGSWDGYNAYLWELTGTGADTEPTSRVVIRKATPGGPSPFAETTIELADKLDGTGSSGVKVRWGAPQAVYGTGSLSAPIRTTYYVGDIEALVSRLVDAPSNFHPALPDPQRFGLLAIIENISETSLAAIGRCTFREAAYRTTTAQPVATSPSDITYLPQTPPALPTEETPFLVARHKGTAGTEDQGVWPESLTVVIEGVNGSGRLRVYRADTAAQLPPDITGWLDADDGILEYVTTDQFAFVAGVPTGPKIAEGELIAGNANGKVVPLQKAFPMGTGLGLNTTTGAGTAIVATLQRIANNPTIVAADLKGGVP